MFQGYKLDTTLKLETLNISEYYNKILVFCMLSLKMYTTKYKSRNLRCTLFREVKLYFGKLALHYGGR